MTGGESTGGAEGERQTSALVRIVIPQEAGVVLRNVAAALRRQISEHCDAEVVVAGGAPVEVELAVEPGIGAEGFHLTHGPNSTVRIVGNDERGVLYGVGRLLRTSLYGRGRFTPGTWRGASVAKCPVRAVYLAAHFNSFHEAAPCWPGRETSDRTLFS